MRWATIRLGSEEHLAFSKDSEAWYLWKDFTSGKKDLGKVNSFLDLLKNWRLISSVKIEATGLSAVSSPEFARPFLPEQFRDFYAFEEHVMRGRKSRGLEMIPEWYEIPVFYFSNRFSFVGTGEVVRPPKQTKEFDFELEIGCVVCREITNASINEAEEAIFGYTLVNDFSSRDLQRKEMKLNLGPAKGKDTASSFGPWVIQKEAIQSFRSLKGYDLDFEVSVNRELIARNSWKKIQYSFAEMLAHASSGCTIYPGELVASGTLGGGCLLEQNLDRDESSKRWLKSGDEVSLSCPGLKMTLINRIG